MDNSRGVFATPTIQIATKSAHEKSQLFEGLLQLC